MAGAPEGNDNRAKQYRIKYELEAALERKSKTEGRDLLALACEKVLENAAAGDLPSFKEVADRMDGRAKQQTELSGPDGGAIPMKTVVNFVAGGS